LDSNQTNQQQQQQQPSTSSASTTEVYYLFLVITKGFVVSIIFVKICLLWGFVSLLIREEQQHQQPLQFFSFWIFFPFDLICISSSPT